MRPCDPYPAGHVFESFVHYIGRAQDSHLPRAPTPGNSIRSSSNLWHGLDHLPHVVHLRPPPSKTITILASL